MTTKSQQSANVPKLRFPGFSGEWEDKPLGQLLNPAVREVPKPQTTYVSLGIRSHFRGTFQKKDVDPAKVAMDTLFVVKHNDLIVNITFAWEGAVAIVKQEDSGLLVSHRFPTYKFQHQVLDVDFFRYVFPTNKFKYWLKNISPGGAGRNRVLNKKDFLKLRISTPLLTEQQKIASFLSSVDAWIENLHAQKEKLEAYKKGMMQQIFSQEIRFKDDNGKDFPDWEEKRLGEVAQTYNGLSGKRAEDFGSGEPFITYKQIFDSAEIDVAKFAFVKVDSKENQNKVQFGDVLFTTSSETPEEVGFASVYLEKTARPYLNSFSFGYRPNSLALIDPVFAKYLFRSPVYRRKVIKLAQGSTRYNISKTGFMKLSLLFPSIVEQKKIGRLFTSLDGMIESKHYQWTQVDKWKKGLMQQMFV